MESHSNHRPAPSSKLKEADPFIEISPSHVHTGLVDAVQTTNRVVTMQR